MSKVIFFVRPMHGHVNPTIGLVNELVARGEEVIYYTTEIFREKIEQVGAVCRIYPDSAARMRAGADPKFQKDETPIHDFEKKLEMVFRSIAARLEDVKTQEQDLYEDVKNEKPGYVIYDYIDAFWGKMLARKLAVPAVASINTFATCDKLVEKDPVSLIKYVLFMSPQQSPFKDSAIDIRSLIDFISARIGQAYNLEDFNVLNYGNSELLNIVHTSSYFQPHSELFDKTFSFVGCSIPSGREEVDFPYEKLDERPLIFISLGTNFNRQVDFYRKCLEAFGNTDRQVVLSVGNRIDPAQLGDIPGNFIVKPFVPQLEILKRSTLFITHGGINSVTEGIYYNVPLIVFPQHGDQFAVAHQVNRLGAGICLESPGITPGEIREAADSVYADETYRRNCRKIKESFDSAGGVKRAADEIFKLKEKTGIN